MPLFLFSSAYTNFYLHIQQFKMENKHKLWPALNFTYYIFIGAPLQQVQIAQNSAVLQNAQPVYKKK